MDSASLQKIIFLCIPWKIHNSLGITLWFLISNLFPGSFIQVLHFCNHWPHNWYFYHLFQSLWINTYSIYNEEKWLNSSKLNEEVNWMNIETSIPPPISTNVIEYPMSMSMFMNSSTTIINPVASDRIKHLEVNYVTVKLTNSIWFSNINLNRGIVLAY